MNFHPSILSCLLPQLTSPRLAVRKRTIIALGHLVMSCGNLVFVDLIEHLLSELSRNDSMSTTRTYIQSIAAISRQAGHRIGKKMTFSLWKLFCFFLFPSLFCVLYTQPDKIVISAYVKCATFAVTMATHMGNGPEAHF